MIPRYEDPRVAKACSLLLKYEAWQTVELAVIEARVRLGRISPDIYEAIKTALWSNPIDPQFVEEKEKELHHDLNAFLDERGRFLTPNLKACFHQGMTSYDTEETAFVIMLRKICDYVQEDAAKLQGVIKCLAIKYRYTPMNARTHGQEAEMQSFGKRCLTWHQDLEIVLKSLATVRLDLRFSRLSGAIGTNSGIDPELEKTALMIFGFEPWAGSTQIMSRALYSPIANALADIAAVCDKIAHDIRLMARSGRPLVHEPFGKKQKGSSAMPHKKNTILCENTEGMARMARCYALGLSQGIKTWEERSIEQSSIERVFWGDLSHVVLYAIRNMAKVTTGLVVYPDNMLREIIESRGCYASSLAKELLTELGQPFGISRDDAYRIVQLACFNVFAPDVFARDIRVSPSASLEEASNSLLAKKSGEVRSDTFTSIENVISLAQLRTSDQLEADKAQVDKWNQILRVIFPPNWSAIHGRWEQIFQPSHILANEAHLFRKVFDV